VTARDDFVLRVARKSRNWRFAVDGIFIIFIQPTTILSVMIFIADFLDSSTEPNRLMADLYTSSATRKLNPG
jgi:hypothetical protein